MVPQKLRDDSEMVKFVIRLHYDTLRTSRRSKKIIKMSRTLQRQEHANLRLRDAIEQCKADKEAIIESLVPDEVADTLYGVLSSGFMLVLSSRRRRVGGVLHPRARRGRRDGRGG